MVEGYTAEQGLNLLEYLGLKVNLSGDEIRSFLDSWDQVYRRKEEPLAAAREIYSNFPLTHGDGNGSSIETARTRGVEFDKKLKEAGLDIMLKYPSET